MTNKISSGNYGDYVQKKLLTLNEIDRRILHELTINSRQGIRKIARTVKKSPQFVNYRIKKLQQYISQYTVRVNRQKTHYYEMICYINLIESKKDKNKILESLYYLPKVTSMIISQGNDLNLIINHVFKNPDDIRNNFTTIYKQFGSNIRSMETLIPYDTIYFGHRYLVPEYINNKNDRNTHTDDEKTIRLNDRKDKILRILSANSMLTHKQISKEIGCSPETVRYTINTMEKEGIITGYPAILSTPYFYRIMIKTAKVNENVFKKFVNYGRITHETIQIVRIIGRYNLFYDIYSEEPAILRRWLNNLRSTLGDHISDYSIINLWDIKKYSYYPLNVKYLKNFKI